MTTHREHLLFGLLDLLLRDPVPSLPAMALRLGVDRAGVEEGLAHLAKRGLVHEGRLTMRGLAAASSLRAARLAQTAAA